MVSRRGQSQFSSVFKKTPTTVIEWKKKTEQLQDKLTNHPSNLGDKLPRPD